MTLTVPAAFEAVEISYWALSPMIVLLVGGFVGVLTLEDLAEELVGDLRDEHDDEAHEVRRDGRVVDVSPTEFKLLRYLMMNPNRVLSKAQILDHVWEYDFNGDASIVESYISYLRRKVDTGDVQLIHTVRGVGYKAGQG